MQGYSRLGRLPAGEMGGAARRRARWCCCWWGSGSLFGRGPTSVDVAFYFFGQIYGILLISQFWTLANDPLRPSSGEAAFRVHRRRRKPGGGRRRRITPLLAKNSRHRQPDAGERRRAHALRRDRVAHLRQSRSTDLEGLEQAGKEEGVSSGEAIQPAAPQHAPAGHRAVIAMTSIGAGLIEQQLSMAAEAAKGAGHRRHDGGARRRAGVHVGHRLRHPGLADEQDPAVPRDRVRADDPADRASGRPRIADSA